jgi:hypothetical protein
MNHTNKSGVKVVMLMFKSPRLKTIILFPIKIKSSKHSSIPLLNRDRLKFNSSLLTLTIQLRYHMYRPKIIHILTTRT